MSVDGENIRNGKTFGADIKLPGRITTHTDRVRDLISSLCLQMVKGDVKTEKSNEKAEEGWSCCVCMWKFNFQSLISTRTYFKRERKPSDERWLAIRMRALPAAFFHAIRLWKRFFLLHHHTTDKMKRVSGLLFLINGTTAFKKVGGGSFRLRLLEISIESHQSCLLQMEGLNFFPVYVAVNHPC